MAWLRVITSLAAPASWPVRSDSQCSEGDYARGGGGSGGKARVGGWLLAAAATRAVDRGAEGAAWPVAVNIVGPHASMDAQVVPPLGMLHGTCPDDSPHEEGDAVAGIR